MCCLGVNCLLNPVNWELAAEFLMGKTATVVVHESHQLEGSFTNVWKGNKTLVNLFFFSFKHPCFVAHCSSVEHWLVYTLLQTETNRRSPSAAPARPWCRRWTTCSALRPCSRGRTWTAPSRPTLPPCCWTSWRRELSCWRTTCTGTDSQTARPTLVSQHS